MPCTPIRVVTGVSQMAACQVCSEPASECLLDQVLHGLCPNVMTSGERSRSGGFLDQARNSKQCVQRQGVSTLLRDKPTHAGMHRAKSPPTVRTPNWSRPMEFYPSWRCYHTPKCATYVCVCLTLHPSVADIISLHSCLIQSPSQLLVPIIWRAISVLAPILRVNGKSPTY